jgi:hypothetical protein
MTNTQIARSRLLAKTVNAYQAWRVQVEKEAKAHQHMLMAKAAYENYVGQATKAGLIPL